MSTNDGGPAFAGLAGDDGAGMSLRDWFAGMAFQGMCANEVWCAEVKGWARDKNRDGRELIAKQAYELTDAMLTERDKPQPIDTDLLEFVRDVATSSWPTDNEAAKHICNEAAKVLAKHDAKK